MPLEISTPEATVRSRIRSLLLFKPYRGALLSPDTVIGVVVLMLSRKVNVFAGLINLSSSVVL